MRKGGGGRGLARLLLLRGRRIPAPLMQWRPAQLGRGSGGFGVGMQGDVRGRRGTWGDVGVSL